MKYAIMSDIHGNLEAFKRAVADAKKRKCKKIICLGDLTGYGKQSKACIEYAMRNVDMCLMGNHDSVCCEMEDLDAIAENRNFDVDVATRRLLTFGQMAWLMARPHIWCCPAFACTHGDFTSPKEWALHLRFQERPSVAIVPVGAGLVCGAHAHPVAYENLGGGCGACPLLRRGRHGARLARAKGGRTEKLHRFWRRTLCGQCRKRRVATRRPVRYILYIRRSKSTAAICFS